MEIGVEELIKRYRNTIKIFYYLNQVSVFVTFIASTWFLWFPQYNTELMWDQFTVLIIAFVITIVGLVIAKNLVLDPDSAFRFILYIFVGIGISSQYALGIEVFYPTLIITIAMIIKFLTDPTLEQISRTQDFSSEGKVSDEVINSIQVSYNYLLRRRQWLFSMILITIALSIISTLIFISSEILPLVLNPIIGQYISLSAFVLLFLYLALTIFPKIEQKDIYNEHL